MLAFRRAHRIGIHPHKLFECKVHCSCAGVYLEMGTSHPQRVQGISQCFQKAGEGYQRRVLGASGGFLDDLKSWNVTSRLQTSMWPSLRGPCPLEQLNGISASFIRTPLPWHEEAQHHPAWNSCFLDDVQCVSHKVQWCSLDPWALACWIAMKSWMGGLIAVKGRPKTPQCTPQWAPICCGKWEPLSARNIACFFPAPGP